MGSSDGIGYSELPEDVGGVYGSSISRGRGMMDNDEMYDNDTMK